MRKSYMKICASILAVVMAFTGCQSDTTKTTEATNPVKVSDEHEMLNTLHKVTVTEGNRAFVTNGKSDYKIIAASDDKTQQAAYYLQKYVEKATGCRLEIVGEKKYSKSGKFILMNMTKIFEKEGLKMPEDDLGTSGYYIKTVGDNVFMESNYDIGARFMMLAFLRNVLGYKMYNLNAVTFEKDGSVMPDMEIIESPDIPYFHRMHNSSDDAEENYMMGFTKEGFISIDGDMWHNSLNFLPMEKYQKEHPKWFSTENNDLCYTGHGDAKEVDAMTTIIADRIVEEANNNPNAIYAACTIMDHTSVCKCKACVASSEKYKGSEAAAVVKFTNQINKKVQAALQKQADKEGTKKRPFTILFFAYHAMTQPPAIKNADGTYSPIDDSVVCDENVAVFYAPINAMFNQTFYEDDNKSFKEMLEGWSACTDEIFCWLYETNFMFYMYPYNCWDTMLETYRFCVNTGATYIMGQDQHNASGSTAFTDLKDYINSCAQNNLSQDYEDILDDYFKNYYKEAEKPMRQLFDEIRSWMRYLENEYPAELNGGIYAQISETKYWPKNTLEHWLSLTDEALESIKSYKDTDKLTYEYLVKRIKKESMFMRYALIEHYSGTFSAEKLLEMKLSFKEDAQALNLSRMKEGDGGELIYVYETWGIK